VSGSPAKNPVVRARRPLYPASNLPTGRTPIMRLLLATLALALTGCVPATVLMRGPDGKIERCEPGAGAVMLMGYVGGQMSVDSCVEAYRSAGYVPLRPGRAGAAARQAAAGEPDQPSTGRP
jgi:hypothetical protein